MKSARSLFFGILAVCLIPFSALAQLAEWTFENITSATPTLPIEPSSSEAEVSGSANLSGGNNNGSPDQCNGVETWSTNFWPSSSSRVTAEYIEFSLTVVSDGVDISSFSFVSKASSSSSALGFDVYYSTDGFASETFLFSGTHTQGGEGVNCTVHAGSLNVSLGSGSTIDFRIFPYGQNAAQGAASIRLDDVQISGAVLPVTLTDFYGSAENELIRLVWETSAEVNNDFFVVERSTDARHFAELGRVRGAGTTTAAQLYEYTDRRPEPATNYYRLRQVDFDGRATYHHTIAIRGNRNGDDYSEVKVYPTLAMNELFIHFPQAVDKALPFVVLNQLGQELKSGLIPAQTVRHQLSLAGLSPGVYFLRWPHDGGYNIMRFVKI